MANSRQGIHFDFDTKELEKYYPQKSWRQAYQNVKDFLLSNGFVHEQGSGYHTKEPMTQADAVLIVKKMTNKYPWLNKCVKAFTIADYTERFNITDMFDKKADIPERSIPSQSMKERMAAAVDKAENYNANISKSKKNQKDKKHQQGIDK